MGKGRNALWSQTNGLPWVSRQMAILEGSSLTSLPTAAPNSPPWDTLGLKVQGGSPVHLVASEFNNPSQLHSFPMESCGHEPSEPPSSPGRWEGQTWEVKVRPQAPMDNQWASRDWNYRCASVDALPFLPRKKGSSPAHPCSQQTCLWLLAFAHAE